MADDEEEIMEPEADIDELGEGEELVDPDLDPDELDGDEALEEDVFEDLDDEFAVLEEPEDEEEAASTGPVRRAAAGEDEDEDDDLLAPDDVEADLDTILKDRLVASDDEGNEDDEEPEDRSEQADRLQPKRADERLCSNCFLLIRQSAPVCPVGDDDCPLFQ